MQLQKKEEKKNKRNIIEVINTMTMHLKYIHLIYCWILKMPWCMSFANMRICISFIFVYYSIVFFSISRRGLLEMIHFKWILLLNLVTARKWIWSKCVCVCVAVVVTAVVSFTIIGCRLFLLSVFPLQPNYWRTIIQMTDCRSLC